MDTPQTHHSVARVDMYTGIHKALRAFMSDTLAKAARVDVNDDEDVQETLQQVRQLADFCLGHLQHENDFVHKAMEAKRPGSANATAEDHVHHEAACEKLHQLADAIEEADIASRPVAAMALHRYLSLFIADNFMHMNVEETENNAVLWALYSDDELNALHQAIVSSLPPEEMAIAMRWMIPAFNPAERAELIGDMRDHAPAPVFEHALAVAKQTLHPRDWMKLSRALALTEKLAA